MPYTFVADLQNIRALKLFFTFLLAHLCQVKFIFLIANTKRHMLSGQNTINRFTLKKSNTYANRNVIFLQ
jgi:hypothetical protein